MSTTEQSNALHDASAPAEDTDPTHAQPPTGDEDRSCYDLFCGGPPDMEWNYMRWQTEILCGFSVALAQVSEATAFAFVAGVEPYVGLTAGWIVGLITALFGGRPAMICGATGAIAAVQTSMVDEDGTEHTRACATGAELLCYRR